MPQRPHQRIQKPHTPPWRSEPPNASAKREKAPPAPEKARASPGMSSSTRLPEEGGGTSSASEAKKEICSRANGAERKTRQET